MPETKENGGFGATVGSIIVVIIIILGGIYVWGGRLLEEGKNALNQGGDAQVEALQKLNASDEAGDISKDLEATDLNNLDADLGGLDQELQSL